jgi:hypothetical protein
MNSAVFFIINFIPVRCYACRVNIPINAEKLVFNPNSEDNNYGATALKPDFWTLLTRDKN